MIPIKINAMYYTLTKLGRQVEKAQVKLMMRYGLLPYQPDPFGLTNNVSVDRDAFGTIQKWTLISKHLPKEQHSALDIGCNIGYFSFKMAQQSASHVIGLDSERGPLIIAEKLKILSRVDNVGFCTLSLNSENIDTLGEYDVVLFLSVFHHLVYRYDLDVAQSILSKVIGKTRKLLFFESGQGDQGYGKMASAMPKMKTEEVEHFFTRLLMGCGAGKAEVIGESVLNNDTRRLLFKVTPS